jgi:hypothetical protein
MQFKLKVVNLAEARFECTFGRGCDGHCCREGRPPLEPEEITRIEDNLEKFLPLLRPRAKSVIRRKGFVSGFKYMGQPTLRLADHWCVFFNQGCVLHQVGANEGDKMRYKPIVCGLFPLELDDNHQWFIRQKGFNGEEWNLRCLDPSSTNVPAAESLREEIAMAEQVPVGQP